MQAIATKWALRTLLVLTMLAAGYLFLPYLKSAMGEGLGLLSSALLVLAYVFALVALPLGLFALFKFGYSLFARPYLRLRRIQRIRDRRYLREAVRRGRFKVIVNPDRANSDPRRSPPEAGP
ncbi:MAG TPA: hypothetical protein VFR84_12810 [Candidatus Angelobacter sp.]|nr:hypothetical protein [Candidatus Angelobacter sp.]